MSQIKTLKRLISVYDKGNLRTMPTEKDIQDKAVSTLKQQGYTYLGSNLSLEDVEQLFFSEFERLNKTKLSNGQLTDAEKIRVRNALPLTARSAYSVLRHGITITLDSNKTVNLNFYDRHNVTNNTFHVTEELNVPGIHKGRLDLVLLMNGVPIVHMELKKPGTAHGVDEALDQINRYNNAGIFSHSLMRFIQVYCISNNITTKYFAASPQAEQTSLKKDHKPYRKAFYWTDEKNKKIHELSPFIEAFLNPQRLMDTLSYYIILTPAEGSNETFILRPYQLYAVENAMTRLLETNHNGFIWHATGSGKTLTSYMLATSLAQTPKFHKTIMLLDRNDLADQTITEYRSFNNNFVKDVTRGKSLHEQLTDPTEKFVLTTLQSFKNWLKKHRKTSTWLNKKPVCFVVDECHRTTFGGMFKDIRQTFNNAQFVGFTGTPRLAENPTDRDLLTKDIFGEPIHIYTTKNAIDDGNVLPFSVSEVSVESNGTPENKSYYRDTNRMLLVSEHISNNLWKNTAQGVEIKPEGHVEGYTAMLATQGKQEAYKYWQTLTPALATQNRTTAMVYSITDNTEDKGEGTEVEWYVDVLTSHDSTFGTDFVANWAEDREGTRKAHLRDVTKRVKNKEIDLLIVSDMLLTGFDAQTLNTIYLDKNLDYHNLLQAMSRTNRVHSSTGKQFGNVVIFSDRQMNDAIDDAILLFSNGENVEGVVDRKNFKTIYNETTAAINELVSTVPAPEQVSEIETPEKFLHVLQLYMKARNLTRAIQTYDEWEKNDWLKLGMTEDLMDEYFSHIYETRKKFTVATGEGTDLIEEIDFHISSISVHTIDVAYINHLLRNATYAPKREKEKWVKKVRNAVETSTDPSVEQFKEVILSTAEAVQAGKITNDSQLNNHMETKKTAVLEERFLVTAEDYLIPVHMLKSWTEEYEKVGKVPTHTIRSTIQKQKLGLFITASKVDELATLITEKLAV